MLPFEDGEGQRLALIDDGGVGDAHPWAGSPVPAELSDQRAWTDHDQHSEPRQTDVVLQNVMNMRPVREYAHPEQSRTYRACV